jgi:hypothetical protein
MAPPDAFNDPASSRVIAGVSDALAAKSPVPAVRGALLSVGKDAIDASGVSDDAPRINFYMPGPFPRMLPTPPIVPVRQVATCLCSSPLAGSNARRPSAPESEIRSADAALMACTHKLGGPFAAGSVRGALPLRRNDFYDAQQSYGREREDLILRLVDVSGVSTLPSTNTSRCRA